MHERFGLDHAGVRREQRHPHLDVRFPLSDERLLHDLQAFDAVVDRARVQRLERLHLVLVVRDDQLSAAVVGNVVPRAEVVEKPAPRSRNVVP